MKKEKIDIFLDNLHTIYNDKSLDLKDETKKEILRQYKKLKDGSTNLAYASYFLYPYIKEESYSTKDEKILSLVKDLEKYKWKAYFGMIFTSPFTK